MAYKNKSEKTQKQNEYIGKTYDRINLLVPKGRKEQIQTLAQKSDTSVTAYINYAVNLLEIIQQNAEENGESVIEAVGRILDASSLSAKPGAGNLRNF